MSVFIGASSTTLALAFELRNGPRAHYTSNMLDVADVLGEKNAEATRLVGGIYNAGTRTLDGFEVLEGIERRAYDLAFIGVTAIDARRGILGPTEFHVALARTLRAAARELVVLATASKFGRSDIFTVLAPRAIDVIVSDGPPPREIYARFEDVGIKLLYPQPSATSMPI